MTDAAAYPAGAVAAPSSANGAPPPPPTAPLVAENIVVGDLERLKPEPVRIRLRRPDQAPGVDLGPHAGREFVLLFDLEALAWLEKQIGSLIILERIGTFEQPIIDPLVRIIAAGIRHDRSANVRLQRSAEQNETVVLLGDVPLLRLLDVADLRDHIATVRRALAVALPWGKVDAGEPATPTSPTSTASTGSPSTTPGQSFSEGPIASSGA